MVKVLRVDEDVYQVTREFARETGRSITGTVNYLLRNSIILERRMEGAKLELKGDVIEVTPPKKIPAPKLCPHGNEIGFCLDKKADERCR